MARSTAGAAARAASAIVVAIALMSELILFDRGRVMQEP
jgi:hypothetical protein